MDHFLERLKLPELTQSLLKTEEGTHLNSFHETNTTLISKPENKAQRKLQTNIPH